jgi:hypothetical protein
LPARQRSGRDTRPDGDRAGPVEAGRNAHAHAAADEIHKLPTAGPVMPLPKGATMRDKDTKKRSTRISPHASEANTGTELSETELKDVTGGKVTMQDFSFTMKMNKSSPS